MLQLFDLDTPNLSFKKRIPRTEWTLHLALLVSWHLLTIVAWNVFVNSVHLSLRWYSWHQNWNSCWGVLLSHKSWRSCGTFWFRGGGSLTRLPRCPGQSVVEIELYHSTFETHLGGGVNGVQGWVPPTGFRGVWVGLARGGPWGCEGEPRPGPGQWNF